MQTLRTNLVSGDNGPAVGWVGSSSLRPRLWEICHFYWKPILARSMAPVMAPKRQAIIHGGCCQEWRETPGFPTIFLCWTTKSATLRQTALSKTLIKKAASSSTTLPISTNLQLYPHVIQLRAYTRKTGKMFYWSNPMRKGLDHTPHGKGGQNLWPFPPIY